MPIKYINPITTPYSRIGDVAYFDRKAMEEQNKYDKALSLIAKQKEQDANTISYNDEARKQYLKEIQANYDKVVQDNYGNLAKGYNDVLDAITKDASHPYHNLNKIQATNIAEYKQAQQRYGVDLITVKSPYDTPLYDAKTNQWADPSSLQYKAEKASDYAKNVEQYIGNDLRGSLQQLGIQPNSKIKYLLEYGSVKKLTKDQIRQLAQSPEAIQLFKSLNPTYKEDNREAVGYNSNTGQNIFSTNAGISNYIYSVLQDKSYSKANVQHMWNKTAMAEDAAKAKALKVTQETNKNIIWGTSGVNFSKNSPKNFPKNVLSNKPTYRTTIGSPNVVGSAFIYKQPKNKEEIKNYSEKLAKMQKFLGEGVINGVKTQIYNNLTKGLPVDENGKPILDENKKKEIEAKVNNELNQYTEDTYNKFYKQRISDFDVTAKFKTNKYSLLNSENMLKENFVENNNVYIGSEKITNLNQLYAAFGGEEEYRKYIKTNKKANTHFHYSPYLNTYAVSTNAKGKEFSIEATTGMKQKMAPAEEIQKKILNTDYYELNKPAVKLDKQYMWSNGASLVLNPITNKSVATYAPKYTEEDIKKLFPTITDPSEVIQMQQKLLNDINNATSISEAWSIINSAKNNHLLYTIDPSSLIQPNMQEVMNQYKTKIKQQ